MKANHCNASHDGEGAGERGRRERETGGRGGEIGTLRESVCKGRGTLGIREVRGGEKESWGVRGGRGDKLKVRCE